MPGVSRIPKDIFIPPATRQKMHEIDLTEYQVLDIFHNGKHTHTKTGWNAMRKRIGRYDAGLYYTKPTSGKGYTIVAVWKDKKY